MKYHKVLFREDLLMKKFIEIVDTASKMNSLDQKNIMKKLRTATKIQVQIEELRRAKLN